MAVILGYDDWQRLTGARPSFAEVLLSFPDAGDIPPDPAPARGLDP